MRAFAAVAHASRLVRQRNSDGFGAFREPHRAVAHAAMVGFANVFSVLPITPEATAGLSGAAKIIGAIQSIFAALLLFLLGLGIGYSPLRAAGLW
jgi:hypothetical protein